MVVGDLQIWDQDRSRIESPGGRFSIGILVFGDVMSGSQPFFVFPDDLSRWTVMRWSVPSILLVGILRDSHEPWKKTLVGWVIYGIILPSYIEIILNYYKDPY